MNKNTLILPAVRGRLGIRDYYLVTMDINDVIDRIDLATKYIASNLPSAQLQRSVDEKRAKKISDYLINNEERFFNSLVVGLFGEPKWQKFSDLPEPLNQFEHNIGFLTLSANDKMYAIDGQHRLEGIRGYCQRIKSESNKKLDETISIVFIQHEDNEPGKKRSRRLFTVLNKEAKRVSKLNIIYLDEDDTAAIITRKFLEDKDSVFFQNKPEFSRIHAISSNLPSSNNHSFTTVESLYASIMDLIILFTKKGRKYHENNANSKSIESIYGSLVAFFGLFIDSIPEIKQYFETDISQVSPIITKNRNNDNGGHVLFRPAGFMRFIKVFCNIYKKQHGYKFDLEKARALLIDLSNLPFKLNEEPCIGLIWDDSKKTLIKGFPMLNKVYLHMMGQSMAKKDKDSYEKLTGKSLPKKITI